MSAGCIARTLFAYFVKGVYCAKPGERENEGFGNFVWAESLSAGKKIAANHKKPVMVIIHKSWCPSCQKLKDRIASSKEILSLSKNFVMVNLSDDDEPEQSSFAPDGTYIPRILFLTPKGSVDRHIYNEEGSQNSKYFYSKPEHIVKSMRKVLLKYDVKVN